MTRLHRIRLHAAWKRLAGAPAIGPSELETGAERPGGQAAEVVHGTFVSLPDLTLRDCFAPSATYCRHFNRPTGIGPENKIWIDCDLFVSASKVVFNGQELLASGPRLEITDLLRSHNELRVVIPAESFARASLAAAAELTIEAEA